MKHVLLVLLLTACGSDSTTGSQDASDLGDGGGSGSGEIDAATDAAPPDGGGGTAGVTCGMMTCASGMECCTTFQGGATYTCIAAGATCQGFSQSCDGPEDCTTGDRCCGSGGGVECSSTAGSCIELCHTATDCAEAGDMCCTTQLGNFCAASCP